MAGGVPKMVPLRSKTLMDGEEMTANDAFYLDYEELEVAITDKTRVLIVNSPHNPTGKMFSMEELTKISGKF